MGCVLLLLFYILYYGNIMYVYALQYHRSFHTNQYLCWAPSDLKRVSAMVRARAGASLGVNDWRPCSPAPTGGAYTVAIRFHM